MQAQATQTQNQLDHEAFLKAYARIVAYKIPKQIKSKIVSYCNTIKAEDEAYNVIRVLSDLVYHMVYEKHNDKKVYFDIVEYASFGIDEKEKYIPDELKPLAKELHYWEGKSEDIYNYRTKLEEELEEELRQHIEQLAQQGDRDAQAVKNELEEDTEDEYTNFIRYWVCDGSIIQLLNP